MFDTQAWYVRDLIMGKSLLPPREERQKDILEWEEKQDQVRIGFLGLNGKYE